jgi:hypothetical protein
MSDRAELQVTGPVTVIPTPSCIRPRPAADDQARVQATPGLPAAGEAGSRRTAAREVLEKALRGVRLSSRDRSFVARLLHWDKRNATAVASLLIRAREAGREEGGLTPRQREVVIAALRDAALYRASGAAGAGCWDCEIIPGGRCAEHAKDFDRAVSYAELEATLAGTAAPSGLPEPRDIAGYRRRTPVAS